MVGAEGTACAAAIASIRAFRKDECYLTGTFLKTAEVA